MTKYYAANDSKPYHYKEYRHALYDAVLELTNEENIELLRQTITIEELWKYIENNWFDFIDKSDAFKKARVEYARKYVKTIECED